MEIGLIVKAIISMIPVQLKDYVFDIFEDWVKDKTTGIPEKIGLSVIKGARIVTDTEDLPDKGETLEAVVENILEEAAVSSNPKVSEIVHAFDGIIKSDTNPITKDHLPKALVF